MTAAASTPPRYQVPVDVHLILRRRGDHGTEVLLSHRAGDVYASGLLHLPSGHLDGPEEDVVTALVRETREETGVLVDPADLRAAVTVHHRSPSGGARVGFFFEVRRWSGTPHIMEPAVCDAMGWWPLNDCQCRPCPTPGRRSTASGTGASTPRLAGSDQSSGLLTPTE
ncbi:NUDIX domain-containing protein [Streptomyces sp. NPDC054933]